MIKIIFLFSAFLTSPVLVSTLLASEIHRLEVSEVSSLATHVVIGEVISVAADKYGLEDLTVNIRSVLKGKTDEKKFSIQLQSVGVKDFDPQLKQGDMAVFFLKSLANGRGEKAYHGSIALFTKPNFK